MRDRLDVWLYGTRVAHLDRNPDDRLGLQWTGEAEDRWGVGTRLLSAMLPIGLPAVPPVVRNFLDGLLPEGNARTNAALVSGNSPDDTFGLIRAYGRDTAGAALFVSEGEGEPTRAGHYEPIGLAEVADRLRNADQLSPATHDGRTGESSTLPGMVPKVTLHRDGQQWFSCKDGAPSTWILKRAFPPESGIGDIVDTEVACLALARELGLTNVAAEVIDLGDLRAIAVSRYDRRPGEQDPRLHQEDLAQAIGLNTADPSRKFQYGSRMPSLLLAAEVLRRDGARLDGLLRLALFSHLVGNTDMHAKNISFLRGADERVSLAPAYDIAMHLHHPRDNRRSALDVNGKFAVAEIGPDDFVAEAVTWGMPRRRAQREVSALAEQLSVALVGLDRQAHPGVSAAAWELVDRRCRDALASLARSR